MFWRFLKQDLCKRTNQSLAGRCDCLFTDRGREACHLQQSLEERVTFLIIHGLLHLLGYDHDQSLPERRRMEALEAEVMQYLQR